MESKNEIRKRMISAAARSWGVSVRDMEKADPLVSLMIDACASEIEKVSSSIEDARNTMGNKLMELLTPEALLSPYPAMAVAYAYPFDSKFKITPESHFYYTKDNPFDEEELPIEVFFTPVANQMLVSGEVKYLAVNNNLYYFDAPLEKTKLCRGISDKTLPPGQMWLGLKINKRIDNLDEVSFFFDLEDVDEFDEKAFYQVLATSEWEFNDQKITVKTGFGIQQDEENSKKIHLPMTEFNKALAVSKHVRNFYEKNYITLSDQKSITGNALDFTIPYPPVFKELFQEKDLEEKIDGRFLWLKVNFTQHIQARILDHIKCSLNCFPVINRREEHILISGRERVKELQAWEHEQYFDLKSVTNEDKLEIIFEKQPNMDMEGKALFTLRKDNIGRFNKRNALETIRHLNDVFYEEYAAFSKIEGIEHEHLEELNKAIRPFELIFEDLNQSAASSMPYVLLKTDEKNEDTDIDVHYWLTNGTLANGIRENEPLRYDSAELVRDKIHFVAGTLGGADQKRDSDLINEFRYALLTNDRIATLEDIRSLCLKRFGKYVDTVEVKNGVDVGDGPGSGLRHVVDVVVRLKKNRDLSSRDVSFLKKDLEVQLEEKSLNAMPFKVTVVE